MATVFIDTNILVNDNFFRSASAQAFLKACSLLQIEVVIPDVVIDELLGNYRRKLDEKISAFNKSQKELGRLVELEPMQFSVQDELSRYEDWLYELTEHPDINVAPYPSVSLKEIVGKSYENKKPFKEDGDGHKDYIVWMSIKSYIESKELNLESYLITNNTRDFGIKNKVDNFILHPEISGQISKERRSPTLYTSLKSFFDKELAPKLEGITLDAIPDLDYPAIVEITEQTLLDDLPQYSAFGLEGVPFSNDISIYMVGQSKVDGVKLSRIDDEVIIIVNGDVDIEVSGFMDKYAVYSNLHSDIDIYISDADWNDHVMAVNAPISTQFELRLYYSLDLKKVVGHELILPQEIKDEWPYK